MQGCGCQASFKGVVAAMGGYTSADAATPVVEGGESSSPSFSLTNHGHWLHAMVSGSLF